MQLPETIQTLRCSHWAGDETAAERLHLLLDSDLAVITRRALRTSSSSSRLTRELRLLNRVTNGAAATPDVERRSAVIGRSLCDRMLHQPCAAGSSSSRPETMQPRLGATQFS